MNLPNVLSLFRIGLIPVVAYLFYIGEIVSATLVFIVACLTDILDGYIARKFDMITDLGKILDPLADKGMQITVIASMAFFVNLMPWQVVFFIFIKELALCLGGAVLYNSKVVIGSNWWGKAATVVTSVCVIAILFFSTFMSPVVLTVFQYMPVLWALFSFVRYLIIYIGLRGK